MLVHSVDIKAVCVGRNKKEQVHDHYAAEAVRPTSSVQRDYTISRRSGKHFKESNHIYNFVSYNKITGEIHCLSHTFWIV